MLSRRSFKTQPAASPPRMASADSLNVALCRDLRIFQRGKEFVAAACGGFDTGAGPEHAAQRRAYWRQRSRRRSAAAPASTSQAAQALRVLLRTLAARQGHRDYDDERPGVGPASPADANIGSRSRKTASKIVPQPIAAAASMRRNKSFRDRRFGQQGLRLLEKALRAKRPQ